MKANHNLNGNAIAGAWLLSKEREIHFESKSQLFCLRSFQGHVVEQRTSAAIAYNLKKLMKFKEKTVKVIPVALQLPKEVEKGLKKLCFLFLNAPQHPYLLLH